MKKKSIIGRIALLFMLAAALASTGCKKEENVKTEVIMTIEPKGVMVAESYLTPPGYLVPGFVGHMATSGDKTRYFWLKQIEGFTFEEGYVQVIRLEITKLIPAPADSIDESYRLISVVSKTKAQ